MLINLPAKKKQLRIKPKAEIASPTPPPVEPPVLLSAYYYYDVPSLLLTFDRVIDISVIQVDQFIVNDNTVYAYTLQGTGDATLTGAMTVMIPLVVIGPNTQSGLTTTVGATNGIKAAVGGAEWAGVTDFVTEWAS